MIPFFRRIRKKMADDNKPLKYMRYAIGEIALVVIGILIALQINNWNEERKSTNDQYESLVKLKLDLEYDIIKLRDMDSEYNDWIVHANYILTEVLSGTTEKIDSVEEIVTGRGTMNHIMIKKTTYNEMLNTGIFYKISNINLTQQISDYYETAKFEINKLDRDNQNFADFVMSPIKKDQFTMVMRLMEQRNLDYLDWNWLNNPDSEMYQIMESTTIYMKLAITANQLVIAELIEKAENVIESINDQQQKVK